MVAFGIRDTWWRVLLFPAVVALIKKVFNLKLTCYLASLSRLAFKKSVMTLTIEVRVLISNKIG